MTEFVLIAFGLVLFFWTTASFLLVCNRDEPDTTRSRELLNKYSSYVQQARTVVA